MDRRTSREEGSNVVDIWSYRSPNNNEGFSKSIILCMFNPLLERWLRLSEERILIMLITNFEFVK